MQIFIQTGRRKSGKTTSTQKLIQQKLIQLQDKAANGKE